MPRSFLVKTHSSHRVPDYGQLETQRGIVGSCAACEGLVQPQGSVPAFACMSPLHPCREGRGAPGLAPRPCQLPGAPLKGDLNHLHPPPRGAPGGLQAPGEDVAEPPGGFQSLDCPQACPAPTRPPPGPRAFPCKLCEKAPASLGALKRHLRTHALPCVCALCGKAFSRPWLLQGHVRTHTGEKPYVCPLCRRAFADRSNLRAHLHTHSDTRKYPCAGCAKTFSRMALLARHEEARGCPAPESRRPAP